MRVLPPPTRPGPPPTRLVAWAQVRPDPPPAAPTFPRPRALQVAHLSRLPARRAGHDLSVKALLATLGGIEESALIYPSTGGRPKARRMLTAMTGDQQALYDLFNLARWAPKTAT